MDDKAPTLHRGPQPMDARTRHLDSAARNDNRAGSSAIMVVLDLRSPDPITIERATTLARSQSVTLHVVAVVRGGWREWDDRPAVLARFGHAVSSASRRIQSVDVYEGSVRSAAVLVGRKRRVDLVVANDELRRLAVAIADAIEAPVLVARDRRPAGLVLAATDLSSVLYPVLRRASVIGDALDAPVTYFHNASPAPIDERDPLFTPMLSVTRRTLSDGAAAAKRDHLQTLARASGADAIVARAPDTLDAILEMGRSLDADLVVVGHRRRTRVGRWLRSCLADRVLVQSTSSVLVLPLDRDREPRRLAT